MADKFTRKTRKTNCYEESMMEIEEHVFKICQMFGLLLLFCSVWLGLGAGMDCRSTEGDGGSVGCAGGGGRKWKGEATATCRALSTP